MENFVDSLENAQLFTASDALWGSWQVLIKDENHNKNTFISHRSTYRYNRMPFGFRILPAMFECALDIFLSGVQINTWPVYIDVVVIFSKSNS